MCVLLEAGPVSVIDLHGALSRRFLAPLVSTTLGGSRTASLIMSHELSTR